MPEELKLVIIVSCHFDLNTLLCFEYEYPADALYVAAMADHVALCIAMVVSRALLRCHTCRLSTIEARLSLARSGGKITFPHFLEMFRADLLDLKEIMRFLQMGRSAPAVDTATAPKVQR